ncbi:MAG: hypothetical protein A2V67_04850 [Deltaproteobacteria bacterium RBG_13_61_14]|nr:MAG: hypothetical protein A2V67_04850 [Deltaproteobacteria bacterium RBG_13_61_14]
MNEITYQLAAGQTDVHVSCGPFARLHQAGKGPWVCAKEVWEVILQPTGLFTLEPQDEAKPQTLEEVSNDRAW